MELTCVIIDDESQIIEYLVKHISKIPMLRLIKTFINPNEAVQYLKNEHIDLIFLDIEMQNHNIDGIDIMDIVGRNRKYIITSGHSEYALKGYEYDVIDFLHKPYDFERLLKAVKKAEKVFKAEQGRNESVEFSDFIYVKSENGIHRVIFEEICWIESEKNYLSIHTESDRITLKHTIKEIQSMLPKSFIRIHKSFIVPEKKIISIENDEIKVRKYQDNFKLIPIGPTYKQHLWEVIGRKLLKNK